MHIFDGFISACLKSKFTGLGHDNQNSSRLNPRPRSIQSISVPFMAPIDCIEMAHWGTLPPKQICVSVRFDPIQIDVNGPLICSAWHVQKYNLKGTVETVAHFMKLNSMIDPRNVMEEREICYKLKVVMKLKNAIGTSHELNFFETI